MSNLPVKEPGTAFPFLHLARCFLLPWIVAAFALATANGGPRPLCGTGGAPSRSDRPPGGDGPPLCAHATARRGECAEA